MFKNIKGFMRKRLLEHVVDTTAIVNVGNPVLSILETQLFGLSDQVSINSKFIGMTLGYLGLGSVYSKGRDLYNKLFGINENTSKVVRGIYDTAFSLGYGFVVLSGIYFLSGQRDPSTLIFASLSGAVSSLILGIPYGYSIDLTRDLTGIKESNRVPDFIKKQNPYLKKGIAISLTAASALLTYGYFALRK